MRQRTISDFFWRDPEISDISQEDKATLLYFLTSPSSNIIGIYQVVWRIAAEMGWTADQLIVVVKRLQQMGLIEFTDAGWIWVKIWWKHNSAAGAFSPKLIQNARKQLAAMPSEWLDTFLKSVELTGVDRVSIGYPYPIDTTPPNTTGSCISNTTTATTIASLENEDLDFRFTNLNETEVAGIKELLKGMFTPLAQQLADEFAGIKSAGKLRGEMASLAYRMVENTKSKPDSFHPSAGISIRKDRERRLLEQAPKIIEAHQRTDLGRKLAAGAVAMCKATYT